MAPASAASAAKKALGVANSGYVDPTNPLK
jgi:hypothetical protein